MKNIELNDNFTKLSDLINRISNAGGALKDAIKVLSNQRKTSYDYKYGIDKQSEEDAKNFLSEAKFLSNPNNITNYDKYKRSYDAYQAGDNTQALDQKQYVWMLDYEDRLKAFSESYTSLMQQIESTNGQFISRLTPEGIEAIENAWSKLAQSGIRVAEGLKMESDKVKDYSDKIRGIQEKINQIPDAEKNKFAGAFGQLQSSFSSATEELKSGNIVWDEYIQKINGAFKAYDRFKKANPSITARERCIRNSNKATKKSPGHQSSKDFELRKGSSN